jgi:transcriptional regulator with XRE-family HTH domain
MDINNKVATKIKEIRDHKNISQAAIAKQLEISTSAYSRLESGEVQITLNILEKISQLLEVNIVELLDLKNTQINYFNHNPFAHNMSTGCTINICIPVDEVKEFITEIVSKK